MCMQSFLPSMVDSEKGVNITVASMLHKKGVPGISVHHAVAKGTVLTMSPGVSREFANEAFGLSIFLGPIKTAF